MKIFDVYTTCQIEPVRGSGCYLWDSNDNKYLDMYGGHAVISVGLFSSVLYKCNCKSAGGNWILLKCSQKQFTG